MASDGEISDGLKTDAYYTLLTNDGYLDAALVLARSLRNAGAEAPLAILITPETVSQSSVGALASLYDFIVRVPAISGVSTENLSIIGRPDLRSTLTKLSLWSQTQHRRIIYLDADTLVLSSLDHLFSLSPDITFAASPELGFPDCFNSGMMVLTPSEDVYTELRSLAATTESFDGGDQGLLNTYFGDGARGHPSKLSLIQQTSNDLDDARRGGGSGVPARNWHRLSFTYNIEMHKVYRLYVPAVLRYADEHKVLHFIGKEKPWHFPNGEVPLPEDLPPYLKFYKEMVGKWWAVWRSLNASGTGEV